MGYELLFPILFLNVFHFSNPNFEHDNFQSQTLLYES